MAIEAKEQQEHVSDNPVTEITQDTERDSSSEVETTTNPPEENEANEEEIIPHEKSVEKTDGVIEHLDKKEDDIDVTEVYIDLSKVKMDKDGIPEFTSYDRDRLRASGIVFTDFENEIEDARNIIKAVRLELDEKAQSIRESNAKEQIKIIDSRLEEINKESELTESLKDEKEDITAKREFFVIELENLPKNNPAIKYDLETREKEAIKHIATYQNVSRNELQKLQNDGTISALISSASNIAFSQVFVDSIRKSKNEVAVEDDKEIAEAKTKLSSLEQKYQIAKALKDSLDEIHTVKFDFIKQQTELLKSDPNVSKEVGDAINIERLKKVPDIFNKIVSGSSDESLSKEYEDIRNSLVGIDDNELESIKEARVRYTEYMEEIEKFSKTAITLNQLIQFIYREPIAKDNLIDLKIENINSNILEKYDEKFDKVINDNWTEVSKEYNEIEDKIEEKRSELVRPLKEYLRTHGIFNSFISYAFANSETRGFYGRPESMMDFNHIEVLSDKYYNCIRENMLSDTEEDYNKSKMNINSVSMNLNNIIRYFVDLYTNNVDIEWAANFDPDSVLKEFYYEYKDKLDDTIKDYIEVTKVFSHVLCHNIKFQNKYNKFISDICDYINKNEFKLKKVNDGKTIKNKFKFMTDIAFAYQFTASYKRYTDRISEVNEAVNKKREENKDIKYEEFDKWYKETQLAKELAATSTVISSFLHLILGCTVIYAFDEFKDYFLSKNDNKFLASDCYRYLFSEYIIESLAFRNCPKDKTYVDYFKERSKNIAFQSLDYTLQRDVKINESRFETISYIFGYASNCFKDIISIVCSKEDETKSVKEKKNNSSKNKKNNHADLIKSYKAKSKEKKRNLGNFKDCVKEYKALISNSLYCDNVVSSFSDKENIYDITVYPAKDTKVTVLVHRYAKEIKEENVKHIFEKAVMDQNLPISINKAYVSSKKINIENLTNINEKWYYNQFVDGTLGNRSMTSESLSVIDPNTFSLSERCRYILDTCLKHTQDSIIKAAIKIIKNTGVEFEGKTIAVKNNCKFDIKYFKANNDPKLFDGNINFFKSNTWDVISFELNYDIVNEKK